MPVTYTMAGQKDVERVALDVLIPYLRRQPEHLGVKDVSDGKQFPYYRELGVDLLWKVASATKPITIEVKADDQAHTTGNFFFETVSNTSKGTPGCFMTTQADWLYYYLVQTRVLYKLPTRFTREWFVRHIVEFKECNVRETVVGSGGYHSRGRLVPIITFERSYIPYQMEHL